MDTIVDILLEWGDAGLGIISITLLEALRQCNRERRKLRTEYMREMAHLREELEKTRRAFVDHMTATQDDMMSLVQKTMEAHMRDGGEK